jgi:hypothetical protein
LFNNLGIANLEFTTDQENPEQFHIKITYQRNKNNNIKKTTFSKYKFFSMGNIFRRSSPYASVSTEYDAKQEEVCLFF